MTEIEIRRLHIGLAGPVRGLMTLGAPYISVRTASDYWLYATLFSTTCPVAIVDGTIAGAVVAFRSQDDPADVYVQDVIVHPDHRGAGVATAMMTDLAQTATTMECKRIWLTSEADNQRARRAWAKLGYDNTGDYEEHGVLMTRDLKGPGKHRAVYQKYL